MNPNRIADLPLPNSVDGFKDFNSLWNDEGKLKETFLPREVQIRSDDFGDAFILGIVSTPWSRQKTQWDIKIHFKKCVGLTVMRKVSETVRGWVSKYQPGARFPELVCRIDVSQSPMFKDQIDLIMSGVPGEQVELVLETLFRTLKKVFG